MDTASLLTDMLTAATSAAKGHATDLKNYIEARAKLIAEGATAIAADFLSGAITADDARFASSEIREAEKTAILAVEATGQAAAQDAINAALAVASAAVNKAVGFAIL
jgi:hypothetical protein